MTRSDNYTGPGWLREILGLGHPRQESMHAPMIAATDIGVPGYSGGPWLNADRKVTAISYGARGQHTFGDPARFLQKDLDRIKILRNTTSGGIEEPIRLTGG